MIKYFYYSPAPTPDTELKGTPLTIYPQSRADTYPCEVYDGFEADYAQNIASLMYVTVGTLTYELQVYRKGITGEDYTADLATARAQALEPLVQTFLTTTDTTVFTISKFLVTPDSYLEVNGSKLSAEATTVSVANNTITSTDNIQANAEVIAHKK